MRKHASGRPPSPAPEAARVRGLRAVLGRQLRLRQPTRRIRFALAIRELNRIGRGGPLSVLDVGCSDGLLPEFVARRHRDWTIDAVDNDPAVGAEAAARLARVGAANVRVFEADVTQPLGEELYDVVVAFETIHMIPDDDAALASIAAAIRPGGTLLLHSPERDWARVSRIGRTDWPGQARSGYTREDLTRKLERVGLHDVSYRATSRSLARFGSELQSRLETPFVAYAWFPFSVGFAWLDRHGITWGPATSFMAVARR